MLSIPSEKKRAVAEEWLDSDIQTYPARVRNCCSARRTLSGIP